MRSYPELNLHPASLFPIIALLSLLCSSCGKPAGDQASASNAPATTNARTFQVNGIVKSLPPGGSSVVIQHEAIPDFMPAMTMEFPVHDTNQLHGLSPGDQVAFRMVITEDSGWVEAIRRQGHAPLTAGTGTPTAYVPPLQIGDVMPDFTLTNEFGRPITFSQFRGQALALTFIFTRCPFPDFCPRMTSQFAATARRLQSLTNWHLLTISFDPENDTPEVLKRYAELYHYDPQHWSFATGTAADINRLAKYCDLTIQRDGAGFTHNLRVAVMDAKGRLSSLLIGKDWSPDELASAIISASQR